MNDPTGEAALWLYGLLPPKVQIALALLAIAIAAYFGLRWLIDEVRALFYENQGAADVWARFQKRKKEFDAYWREQGHTGKPNRQSIVGELQELAQAFLVRKGLPVRFAERLVAKAQEFHRQVQSSRSPVVYLPTEEAEPVAGDPSAEGNVSAPAASGPTSMPVPRPSEMKGAEQASSAG